MIEFFCAQCHIPVCVYCKMVGNHANGEAAKHQLISVTEAYNTILLESQSVPNQLPQLMLSWIQSCKREEMM
jgi:hypothetical protein